ncbi:hypothetical protein M758_2G009200 [Ceratodon purpureus]|uniref:Uncharacterized protein n=1 Tax=Ceratodon purpureus TaxID=3225 RepID=A0A8T0IRI7_CERPU|nr:hypothetical protein KC19_2G009700 [Ceratodon purpureus]KAG0624850.1 hypothetical protein M758_2G009200 [Ceratodon purpureus]
MKREGNPSLLLLPLPTLSLIQFETNSSCSSTLNLQRTVESCCTERSEFALRDLVALL